MEVQGYEVYSIGYTKLFDQVSVAAFLKRVAKSLIGKDAATRVTQDTAWFGSRSRSLAAAKGNWHIVANYGI